MDLFIMQKSSYMTEVPILRKIRMNVFFYPEMVHIRLLVRDECIKIELEYNIQQFYPTGPLLPGVDILPRARRDLELNKYTGIPKWSQQVGPFR